MKKVILFGTFDGIHPGHENLFQQALELGDELHLVIALDETVTNIKGRPPKYNQYKRLEAAKNHPLVTSARLGHRDDKYSVIEEIQPDIIALGYDQRNFIDQLQSELDQREIKVIIHRLEPYHPEKFKSSIINRQE